MLNQMDSPKQEPLFDLGSNFLPADEEPNSPQDVNLEDLMGVSMATPSAKPTHKSESSDLAGNVLTGLMRQTRGAVGDSMDIGFGDFSRVEAP